MTDRTRVPRTVAAFWAAGALAAAALLAQAFRPTDAPVLALASSVSATPEADAGPSLPDACSRRVGCLLR